MKYSAKPNNILVPVDFSAASLVALDHAAELAQTFGGKLSVLYVVEPIAYPAEFGITLNMTPDLVSKAERELTKLVATRLPSTTVSVAVENGVADAGIIEYAARHGVEMIVMGTHGYGAVKHLLLGSTTERVVRHAPCPVLTLRYVD